MAGTADEESIATGAAAAVPPDVPPDMPPDVPRETAPREAAPGPTLAAEATRARIGRGLRLHYADVLTLPIPERFLTLLDDLAACSDTEAKR
jgi:hypothetical protein